MGIIVFLCIVFSLCAISFYLGYSYGRKVEKWNNNHHNDVNGKKMIKDIIKSNLN
jgi:hypothetical protein